ncbi:porin family protein [Flavobacterium sp. AG291]|uniref:porin family protein n=1 Tax=Flavobacterium sp. AG291 TaxID=2184000 RepID=UPI000E0C314F|nr:porin family protein [Flavobacterium sp. AG291]RDI09773.1 outer membrane protein with beta-barrel domain [Flavobacterium sp. AG291]
MKKIIFLFAMLTAGITVQAQGLEFGFKAGANFSNFSGDVNTDGITSWHAGAALELDLAILGVQVEGLFSSQGAKVEGVDDVNLDYISVPVLAKFYLIPSKLSLTAGPQFSFLVNDAKEAFDTKSFDTAASLGAELKIIGGVFVQARYNIGLSNVNDDSDIKVKNNVFQLSAGYYF